MFFLIASTLIFTIVILIYVYLTRKYDYWQSKKVPHLKPALFFGNFKDYILLKWSFGEVTQALCRKFPGAPYFGAYFGTEPVLIIQDPDLLRLITAKDFYYFSSREVCDYNDRELTTQSLFFLHGDQWKVTRQSMTPLFTPNKMKNMYYLIQKCSSDFKKMLAYETSVAKEVNALSIMARFTIDCIGTTAFGIETKTMERNPEENPFNAIGELLFEISYARAYAYIVRATWPRLFYGLGFNLYPQKMADFFFNMMIGIFNERNNKPSTRNDFVDIVLSLKDKDYITCDNWSQANTDEVIRLKVTDDLLISQCQLIFGAGFETSALTMTYTLYELAKNERVQRKVHEELDSFVKKNGPVLELEQMVELPYLEAAIDETMRMYPALGNITREVVHDYTLPSGLHLERGLRVYIPVLHLHNHPGYFENPENYVPERFLNESKDQIKPGTYIPFGEGSRICIGRRFGKILTLTGLFTLLQYYRLELGDGMPTFLKMEPKALVTRPTTNVRLKLIPRN